jgi:hypothetical protein
VKRDLDLVRSILQWMEARPEGHNVAWEMAIDGYANEEIGYHVHLMGQAGLIIAEDITHLASHSPCAMPISITWAGHEFLGASNDSTLWASAKKKVIGPAGSVAFNVLLEWLKSEAKKKLGLLA